MEVQLSQSQLGLVFLTRHRLHDTSRSTRKNQFLDTKCRKNKWHSISIQSILSSNTTTVLPSILHLSLNCTHSQNLLKKMANARIARFVTEVAPPQFVNVMRQRASKMLDTIKEEEREAGTSESLSLKSSLPSSTSVYSASASNAKNSKYFLKEVQRSLSVFGS
ncbi:hypothetical protein A4A49_39256 [Nicotiana attenuata]|uniref:Uncharacterized protein n=1 Tax=Nicotiana attenuata TaxID=49451 RepID=A0A1J6IG54_NICAT|nr:hypothetical protein A4A49_39256 [Nicotiana attenuata]